MLIDKAKLAEYKNVNFGRVMDYSEMIDPYAKYIETISDNKIYFGYETLDNHLFGIRPPELVTILSEPDIGKTTFVMNMLRYQIESDSFLKNKLLINFSLELNEYDLIERVIQMETGFNSFEIEKKFKTDEKFKEYCFEFVKKYNNIVSVIQRVRDTDIISYVKAIEDMKGKKAALIIVDYLQLISSEIGDDFLRTTRAVQGLKEASLLLNIPIIITSQVSRSAGKNENGLEMNSGKGSGAIEEVSQIVLSLEKVKGKDLNLIDPNTAEAIEKSKCRIIRLKIQKKKRGRYFDKPYFLELEYKNLKLSEYTDKTQMKYLQTDKELF
jgi:replicative DNA helicase